jgi:RND family efflux transporter MFP subunit
MPPQFLTKITQNNESLTVTECPDRNSPKRAWLIGLAVAVSAGAALAQPPEQAKPHSNHRSSLEIRVQLVPLHAATLSSEMAGRIEQIATRVGDHFHRGDVLITFDCAVPRAGLAHAQAVVTQAERTYEIDRREAAQNSTTPLALDIAASEVLKGKADLVAAEAVVAKCSIAAPFAGVTVDRKAREFEYVKPGESLLEVFDDKTFEVELAVPSLWLGWLKVGTPFQVKIDETGKTYPAQVSRFGGRVDPISRSVKVFGEIIENTTELLAGMSGHAIMAPP